MKILFAVILATAMVVAPVCAAVEEAKVEVVDTKVVDAEVAAIIEAEVEEKLQELSKTDATVAAAMQTEASKKKLIAQIVAGCVVVVGAAFAVDYFCNLGYIFKKTVASTGLVAPLPEPELEVLPPLSEEALLNHPARHSLMDLSDAGRSLAAPAHASAPLSPALSDNDAFSTPRQLSEDI